MNSEKGLDLARDLVWKVARTFYKTSEFMIIDDLLQYSVIPDNDLAYLLNTNPKEIHRLCGKLLEHRIMAKHERTETKEGQARGINRPYYFINYPEAVDAIKLRVFKISSEGQQANVDHSEVLDFLCRVCDREWATLDVLAHFKGGQFKCPRCDSRLEQHPSRTSETHEETSQVNTSLKFITDALMEIDKHQLAEHGFEMAWERRIPVERDIAHQVIPTTVVEPVKPAAVKGLVDAGPNLQVSISFGSDAAEMEKQAERDRKAQMAARNAMPEWYTKSTVPGVGVLAAASAASSQNDVQASNAAVSGSTNHSVPVVDSEYWARLAEDMAKQQQSGDDDDGNEDADDDEEDEEYEFEDVAADTQQNGDDIANDRAAKRPKHDD